MTDASASARFKARPTTYKGIRMRSRLEAGYAAWLDDRGWDWQYEPQAFAGANGVQYLPDFLIRGVTLAGKPGTRNAYIEVKPASFATIDNDDDDALTRFNGVFRQMGVIHESEPDALLLLEIPATEGLEMGGVSIVEPDPYVGYWPHTGTWCAVDFPSTPPIIAAPMMRRHCPWFGEWWKGQVSP